MPFQEAQPKADQITAPRILDSVTSLSSTVGLIRKGLEILECDQPKTNFSVLLICSDSAQTSPTPLSSEPHSISTQAHSQPERLMKMLYSRSRSKRLILYLI